MRHIKKIIVYIYYAIIVDFVYVKGITFCVMIVILVIDRVKGGKSDRCLDRNLEFNSGTGTIFIHYY